MEKENVYGHLKKVGIFRSAVEEYAFNRPLVNILDIGCGNGWAVTRHMLIHNTKVLGIDLHEPNIKYAKAKFESDNIRFECKSAESLLDVSDRFHIIILSDILEHVDSPNQILDIAEKLLEEDGIILASIPNGYGPFEFESLISRIPILGSFSLTVLDLFIAFLNKAIFKGRWKSENDDMPYNDDSPHIHFFTFNSFCKMLKKSGLTITREHSLSFLSGPYTNYLFSPSSHFMAWNNRLADLLPRPFSSAWCFVLKKGAFSEG